jgi:hypothetical protein
MHEALPGRTKRQDSNITDWMIDLLEDDRPVPYFVRDELSEGLHWMYKASLVRRN